MSATKTVKLKITDPNKGKLENLQKTKEEINNLLSFYIDVIDKMNSYRSNYNNWLESGKKGNAPKFTKPNMSPTFYNSDFSLEFEDIQNQFVKLRVFDGTSGNRSSKR